MKVKEWVYYLGDGQLSVRQLMDGSGNITLSRTYGPFGQILQEAGNGSAIYGFAGAQAGGGGLLYINDRYFDPTTGRFLSPDNNFDPLRPGTLNGYLSAAFLFAPFGVIIWRKRKKRGGRYDLMLFLMLGIGLGMMLVSCAGSEDGEPPTPIPVFEPPDIGTDTPTPDPTSTPPSPTGTPTNVPTATPNNPATPTPSPTPCPTPTATQGVPTQPSGIKQQTWDTYLDLWHRLNQENSPYLMADGKLDDQYLVATLIAIEIRSALVEGTGKVYKASLEAISYQYHNFDCRGGCQSLEQQLRWMDSMQNWWDRAGRPLPILPDDCSFCWSDAVSAINGYYDSYPAQSYWWGNPFRNSEMANYIKDNFPANSYPPYSLIEDGNEFIIGFRGSGEGGTGGILDYVVVTRDQNIDCGRTNCMGFSSP